jgi:hypothetical protein
VEKTNIKEGYLFRELKDEEMRVLVKTGSISSFERSLAKSLLKYYCSNPSAYEEFEKALFYPAVLAGKDILKWTTFRGMYCSTLFTDIVKT